MKATISLCFFTFLHLLGFSQKQNQDTIYTLRGDIFYGYVLNISEHDVTYQFQEEKLTYTINKKTVEEIKFGTGRKEVFNARIVINGEGDWRFVKTTELPFDVKGLDLKGEVRGRSSKISNGTDTDLEALEDIKRKAAALNAYLIFVEYHTISDNRYVIVGKAYSF